MLVVPEVLGHGQRGVPHAESAARRLVHLSEEHHHVRQDAGLLHVAVKLLAFPATLADTAKDAYTIVVFDHVVDHLGEQHRFSYTGAAKEPRLATALERHERVRR